MSRYDATLATALEPFPPEMAISFKLFQTILQEAQSRAVTHWQAVDLDAINAAIELIQEDQVALQDQVAEQTRIISRIATHLNIDTSSDVLPLPPGAQYHFFISHSQSTGGDQANVIASNLEKRGAKVWYDQVSAPASAALGFLADSHHCL